MENEINPITLPLQKAEDNRVLSKSNIRSIWERFTKRMSRYSWALLLYQSLMGLLLLSLTIIRTDSYSDYWIIGTMGLLFLSGGIYGWIIGKQTRVQISESGDPIFIMVGQWKKFIPMVGVLFSIRIILMLIAQQEIADTAPFMRTLPMVIAGMLTTRGFTMFFRYYILKKENRPLK